MHLKLLMIIALAFVAGSVGASATQQDTLWSVRTGNNQVYDCHFTPSGDSVVAVAGDTLYILQTSTGSILKKSRMPSSVNKFCMFHNSSKLVVLGYMADVYIWDYCADTLVRSIFSTPTAGALDITPDDSLLIISVQRNGNKILKYDIKLDLLTDSITTDVCAFSLTISPDGKYLANSSKWTNGSIDYGQLILRNLNTWEIIKDFDPKYSSSTTQGLIKDIKFSPDGKYIGIAKWDGTVKVYRTDSLDLYRNFVVDTINPEGPIKVCFSNNSQFIYSALFDNFTTNIWNIEYNQLINTYKCNSTSGLDISIKELIVAGSGAHINLLSPKWLSVSDPQQESRKQPTGYIISKSGNQALIIKSNCNNLGSCRLYDVFGNLLTNENILSLMDNGNISINPAQLNTGVYFMAIGIDRVAKVMVVE